MSFFKALYCQDPITEVQMSLILLHDHAMVILIFVGVFSGLMLLSLLTKSFNFKSSSSSQLLETVWTIIPALILIILAIPSLSLLYKLDDSPNETFPVKVTGYQWYWGYFSPESGEEEVLSYMIPLSDLKEGGYRLLEVDNRLTLTSGLDYSINVTSKDVLHSWALPSAGIKIDAVPGRINQIFLNIFKKGVFYGNCSEICGANHSFMPIVVQVKFTDNLI